MEVTARTCPLSRAPRSAPKQGAEEDRMRSVDELTAAELLDGLPSRVHEVYAPFVRDVPDHPAFVEGGRSWSYRQFSEAVDAAAKDMLDLGIRPGDRVMIASENSVALGAMLFAASKLDAWGIPVNPRLTAREIDLIETHSGARRMLFNSALSKEATDHATRVGAKVRAVGPFGGIGVGSLNANAKAEPVEKDGAHQVAGLLYTSGTTGAPKGVMLSHRNLLFTARTSGVLRQSGPADRVYGVLPMSHIVGYRQAIAEHTSVVAPHAHPGCYGQHRPGKQYGVHAAAVAALERQHVGSIREGSQRRGKVSLPFEPAMRVIGARRATN
jgi:long-chain acyl-CoA synthetase